MGSTDYVEEMPSYEHSLMAKLVAEFLGTFFLVLTIGCNVQTGSIGAALSIGAMLMVMIFALGSVSGANFNPAVTLAVFISSHGRRPPPPPQQPSPPMSLFTAAAYMCVQILGGICGGGMYCLIVGNSFVLRPTHYSTGDAVGAEVLYTWALCYVVLNVATSASNAGNHYFGLAIGFTVTSAAITVGAVSGCSLNPAVSLGSLIVAYALYGEGAFAFWSFYTWAPFVGAIIASLTFYMVRRNSDFGGWTRLPGDSKFSPPAPPPKTRSMEIARDSRAPRPESQEPKYEPPAKSAPPARTASPERPAAQSAKARLASAGFGSRVLQSGGSVAVNDLGRGLENAELFCGLKWDLQARSKGVDVDASCVKFDKEGRCLGAVYFADKEDAANGIRHSGDQVSGEGADAVYDDECISFKLSDIKSDVHFLYFVATIFSSGMHSFKDVEKCSARLVETSTSKELAKFTNTKIGEGNALVLAMVYRKDGRWVFDAVDRCYQIQEHGTYRALEPQLMRLCRQKKEL